MAPKAVSFSNREKIAIIWARDEGLEVQGKKGEAADVTFSIGIPDPARGSFRTDESFTLAGTSPYMCHRSTNGRVSVSSKQSIFMRKLLNIQMNKKYQQKNYSDLNFNVIILKISCLLWEIQNFEILPKI